MAENSAKTSNKTEDKPVVIRNMTDLQRLKLEKLMKNPDKPVVIPEKPKGRTMPSVPDFVRNVMGSSAGAGSGEFHVYRHLRRKEYARQKFIQEKSERERLNEEYHEKIENNRRVLEEKTAKKRAKRLKKKIRAKERSKKPKNEKPQSESSENDSENSDDDDDQTCAENREENLDNVIKEKDVQNINDENTLSNSSEENHSNETTKNNPETVIKEEKDRENTEGENEENTFKLPKKNDSPESVEKSVKDGESNLRIITKNRSEESSGKSTAADLLHDDSCRKKMIM